MLILQLPLQYGQLHFGFFFKLGGLILSAVVQINIRILKKGSYAWNKYCFEIFSLKLSKLHLTHYVESEPRF